MYVADHYALILECLLLLAQNYTIHAKGKLWKQMSMEFKFRIHFLLNKIMKARHNSGVGKGEAGGGGGGGGGAFAPQLLHQ